MAAKRSIGYLAKYPAGRAGGCRRALQCGGPLVGSCQCACRMCLCGLVPCGAVSLSDRAGRHCAFKARIIRPSGCACNLEDIHRPSAAALQHPLAYACGWPDGCCPDARSSSRLARYPAGLKVRLPSVMKYTVQSPRRPPRLLSSTVKAAIDPPFRLRPVPEIRFFLHKFTQSGCSCCIQRVIHCQEAHRALLIEQ